MIATKENYTFNGKLLTLSNAKTSKGIEYGYLTGVLYMSPAYNPADNLDLCPFRSAGCTDLCLNTSGQMSMTVQQKAQASRRKMYVENKKAFMIKLEKEVAALERKAKREGLKPAVRLDGTTDIIYWVKSGIMDKFPGVKWYDYTKNPHKLNMKLPKNYYITFSWSGENPHHCKLAMDKGFNVAVPFYPAPPKQWQGIDVVNGDKHDLRFLDNCKGKFIGLKYKPAKNARSAAAMEKTLNGGHNFVQDVRYYPAKDLQLSEYKEKDQKKIKNILERAKA